MSLKDLNDCFDLIKDNFEACETGFIGMRSKDLIAEAENILDIKFPLTYKIFIEKVGHGGPGSAFIPGIYAQSADELKSGGIVWGVLTDREKFNYPKCLIGIYDVGDGSAYCLDTSQMNKESECPVVVWPIGGYEETPVLEVVASDFGEFFFNIVKEQINFKSL